MTKRLLHSGEQKDQHCILHPLPAIKIVIQAELECLHTKRNFMVSGLAGAAQAARKSRKG